MKAREIAKAVAEEFGFPVDQICTPGVRGKGDGVTYPRRIVFWLARRHTGQSCLVIGRNLGGFDHSTVVKGCEHVEAALRKNNAAAARILRLDEQLVSCIAAQREPIERDETIQELRRQLRAAQIENDALLERLKIATSTPLAPLVERYIDARRKLDAERYTRSECFARRAADAAYAVLNSTFLAMQPRAKSKEHAHAQ